jgi:AbrB family looped-hinge helix DNA binding protein
MGISGEKRTKVNDSGSVTIPKFIREQADIDAGDSVRWVVDEEGEVSVEIVRERYGAFDDFEPAEGPDRDDVNGVEDLDRNVVRE